MKVKYLWIDKFKNLRNFSITFNSSLTTVILGSNGTGKSNLLEALSIIFRDLDLEQTKTVFEYYLIYECRGHTIEIDANPKQNHPKDAVQQTLLEGMVIEQRRSRIQIKVDGRSMPMSRFFANKQQYLPTHVFGYYSGPTNRLAQHFIPHQNRFYVEQRRGDRRPLRPLFFALPVHSQFVLLAYYSFQEPSDIRFLRDYLGIIDLESVLFVIKEPDWPHVRSSTDLFWGAEGIPRDVLQGLYDAALAPIWDEETVLIRTGKSTKEERLYLYIKDAQVLMRLARKRESNQEFFKDLDTLFISTFISAVRVRVRKMGVDGHLTFSELSEGEQQLLTVLGLLKFTRDSESLFLLDEPDTHLNPGWKWEYMRLIENVVREDSKCQILLITHDPLVMSSCTKEQVRVLTFKDGDRSEEINWFEPVEDPQGMGVEALLTSEIYGLRSSLDWITQNKLDLKRQLSAKPSDELTQQDLETLQQLTQELWDLGFTQSARDPLFARYLKEMTEKYEDFPELEEPVLTKEEQELQDELTREIIEKIKKEDS